MERRSSYIKILQSGGIEPRAGHICRACLIVEGGETEKEPEDAEMEETETQESEVAGHVDLDKVRTLKGTTI